MNPEELKPENQINQAIYVDQTREERIDHLTIELYDGVYFKRVSNAIDTASRAREEFIASPTTENESVFRAAVEELAEASTEYNNTGGYTE